jgi:hypothetical protein
MNDIPRNEAYEIALQEACKGKVVLDVGSVRSRCRLRLQQLIVTTLFCSRGSGRALTHRAHVCVRTGLWAARHARCEGGRGARVHR